MKILLLSGANSPHTLNWANSLADVGHVVYVASQHEVASGYDKRVHIIQLPSQGVIGFIKSIFILKKIVAEIAPDVVNAHRAVRYTFLARLSKARPLVVSVWGSDVYDFPYQSKIHKFFIINNLLAADVVASTSYCMAEQTRVIAPKLSDIPITPFGVDIQAYAKADVLPTNNDKLVIGTVKSMAGIYGIDTQIEAFALLVNKFINTRPDLAEQLQLRLVGDGPQINDYKQLAGKLGVAEKVYFVGRVPHQEVPSELAKLDVYVALSRSESFGVAIIEAGAARRPVVVSNAGGLPEVTLDGITGLVVPRENPQAAADAIEKLVLNPELRVKMGEAGRKHVAENYSREACVKIMEKVFEGVIRK